MSEPSEYPFDVIEIDGGGGLQRLKPSEFTTIPLHERVRLLLEGRMRFLRAGKRVDAQLALASLRVRAAVPRT